MNAEGKVHTPLPWYASGSDTIRADATNEAVCRMADWQGEAEREANAALIVRAVNSHETLVAIVREVVGQWPRAVHQNDVEKLRAVLAGLDGKEEL